MRETAIMFVVLGALFAGNPSAHADSGYPFGFETSKHPLEYECCKKEKDPKKSDLRGHGYTCNSAPRPHPDFQEYVLLFVEDVGLCSIQAVSNVFAVDPANEKFEMFKGQITKKYGPPTSKDTEQTDGRNWRPEIQPHKEGTSYSGLYPDTRKRLSEYYKQLQVRRYGVRVPDYHWSPEAGFKELSDVKAIHLMACLKDKRSKDAVTKVINVTFRLVTADTCLKKIDDMADRAF